MDEKRLKTYLRESLKETPVPRRMEETISLCRAQVREYSMPEWEERTDFLGYLSDIFRYEGLSVFGLQALALLIACLGVFSISEDVLNISFYAPMFSLAALPVLMKGQIHGMSEMEAATRASGAQIVLARLLLAGAANLVCLTLFLCLGVRFGGSYGEVGQLILHVLVPYLSCMAFMLQRIRLCKKESLRQCVIAGSLACAFWGVLAEFFPWLYEFSAGGVWVCAFLIFGSFFVKELWFLWEAGKEGKMYGTID